MSQSELRVQTCKGAVRGCASHTGGACWLGVPYAAPPVGKLRWRAPVPHAPWAGTRDACTFAPPAAQLSSEGKIVGSEDCCYLNVWRPKSGLSNDLAAGASKQLLPVYCWVHGGGNTVGSARQDGAELAERSQVLVVSLAYRLGDFGLFWHEALRNGGGDNPENASGNWLLLDLLEGLRWVRSNAAAFGGDPNNVLLGGQSAGAHNVLALMAATRDCGSGKAQQQQQRRVRLFHKALVQSGRTGCSTRHAAQARGEQLLACLHSINAGAGTAVGDAAFLRSCSTEQLLRAGLAAGPRLSAVIADDMLIPRPPARVTAPTAWLHAALVAGAPLCADVPAIVGTTSQEAKWFLRQTELARWLHESATQLSNGRSPASEHANALAAYEAAASAASVLKRAQGGDEICRALSTATVASGRLRAPVYSYVFRWGEHRQGRSVIPPPHDILCGAAHTIDIPFFFGWHGVQSRLHKELFVPHNAGGRVALGALIMAHVREFMRTGSAGSGWPAWSNTPGAPKSLEFDAEKMTAALRILSSEMTTDSVVSSRAPLPPAAQAIFDVLNVLTTWGSLDFLPALDKVTAAVCTPVPRICAKL